MIDIFFAAGAYRRLLVLGGGRLTFRAVIVYLVERSQMLMARLAQGAGKLKQIVERAREAVKRKPVRSLKRDFAEIEIVDATGSPIGEFDGIDMGSKTFIEDKSAMGIGQINPRTGQPFQTAEQWATKQVYTKFINRIENLKRAAATRATKAGSPAAPSLSNIKDFKNLHFVIDSKDPAVTRAVIDQLSNLKKQYPDWNFTANFGK